MSGLFSAIPFFIWAFVLLAVVTSKIKKGQNTGHRPSPDNSSYASAEQIYAQKRKTSSSAGPAAAPVPVRQTKTGSGMILKDDKANDWLARQLREEARAMTMISDMFQLKIDHRNSCEAEFVKRFHESNCDVHGIDDGNRKK